MFGVEPGTMVTSNLRLERLHGEGAMGSVWVAQHLGLDTEVAVKFIAPDHRKSNQKTTVTRFKREAKAAARIKSPHVVQMFDHGVMDNGTPYMVMELLDGESLGERLRRGGPLPTGEVAQLVAQTGKALAKAHECGIVHRDIKPDNIFLVTGEDELLVKVLDFGIAKHTEDPAQDMTTTGALLGTPLYMSPEVVKSARAADSRADLWALAVVAYEALTGQVPFTGETVGALFFAICGDAVEPASSKRRGLPDAVDAWFTQAFCRDPDGRFGSAKEMARAFAEAIEAAGDAPFEPASAREPAAAGDAMMATSDFVSQHNLEAKVEDEPAQTAVAQGAETQHDEQREDAPEAAAEVEGATAVDTELSEPSPLAAREVDTLEEAGAAAIATSDRPRGRWGALIGAATAAVALAGGAYLWFTPVQELAPQGPLASAPPSAPAAAATEAPIHIRCEPECDAIEIDGERYLSGELARLAELHDETPVAGELRMRIPVGPHRLALVKEGYELTEEAIEIVDGEPFVRSYQLTATRGTIPQQVIDVLIADYYEGFVVCQALARRRIPKLGNVLPMSFVVGSKGDVQDVAIDLEQADEELRSCVARALRRIPFPAPKGGSVAHIEHELRFARQDAKKGSHNKQVYKKKSSKKGDVPPWEIPSTNNADERQDSSARMPPPQ